MIEAPDSSLKASPALVSVWLRIWGSALDPVEVSLALGVPCTKSAVKGAVSMTSVGGRVVAKTGRWALRSGIESDQLSEHIKWLQSALSHASVAPRCISAVDFVELDVFIALAKENGRALEYQSKLKAEELKWIAELGAVLSITSICTGD